MNEKKLLTTEVMLNQALFLQRAKIKLLHRKKIPHYVAKTSKAGYGKLPKHESTKRVLDVNFFHGPSTQTYGFNLVQL